MGLKARGKGIPRNLDPAAPENLPILYAMAMHESNRGVNRRFGIGVPTAARLRSAWTDAGLLPPRSKRKPGVNHAPREMTPCRDCGRVTNVPRGIKTCSRCSEKYRKRRCHA